MLIAIFASYSAAEYLADAVSGLFPPGAVLLMLVLRIAIALEVLLPTTLYLSVVIALGRMYRDSEMVALASCGVGITRILRSVLYLAMVVALLVAGLSIFARPWAYKKVYDLKTLAKEDFDISRMEAGNFYEIKSREHINITFGEIPDRKPFYHRKLQLVAKGWLEIFNESRPMSYEKPFYQEKYINWLQKVKETQGPIIANIILSKNLTFSDYPYEEDYEYVGHNTMYEYYVELKVTYLS